mmetsp:Transcript_64962/g.76885  ORF Transcript_64962/g.76885 Transcript_64962/m.76885 type:complete len:86 (+) Transcript_64962:722-979(+)
MESVLVDKDNSTEHYDMTEEDEHISPDKISAKLEVDLEVLVKERESMIQQVDSSVSVHWSEDKIQALAQDKEDISIKTKRIDNNK